jgi:hypothetical protein
VIFEDCPFNSFCSTEVGGAIGGRYHDLPVDYGGCRLDVPGIVRDLSETMRPVVAAPRVDLGRLVGQMDLDPVAVELDLVNPAVSGRHLSDRGREGRLDEATLWRLDPDGLGLLTLKRH